MFHLFRQSGSYAPVKRMHAPEGKSITVLCDGPHCLPGRGVPILDKWGDLFMSESRNKRVLIVDNDEKEAGTLSVMLEGAGYDSSTTWSGLEALELLRSGDYDILLVSSYLPDLYVGDFFERLNRLPVRPCSIIMNEGRTPAATISEMKSMIGEVKCQ